MIRVYKKGSTFISCLGKLMIGKLVTGKSVVKTVSEIMYLNPHFVSPEYFQNKRILIRINWTLFDFNTVHFVFRLIALVA